MHDEICEKMCINFMHIHTIYRIGKHVKVQDKCFHTFLAVWAFLGLLVLLYCSNQTIYPSEENKKDKLKISCF